MPKLNMENTRKEQVVKATKNCIVKQGLSNLTMNDIASEAEVSTGIIYNYFKNKEDVLLHVLKDSFLQSHKMVMETVEPLHTPKEKLTRHLENINAVPKENPEFYLVLLNYLGQAKHRPEIQKVVVKFFNNLKAYTNEYLHGAVADTQQRENLSVIVYALGLGLGIMWTMDNQFFDIDEMEHSVKELMNGFIDNKQEGR